MIHLHDLKEGNWVEVEYEGEKHVGEITETGMDKVAVETEDGTEYWYEPKEIFPVPLTKEWLEKFQFLKSDDPEINGDGVVYERGPFLVKFKSKEDDRHLFLAYRSESHREFDNGLAVHEFQNHYHGMTKVPLER